jgi:hypothetical protein
MAERIKRESLRLDAARAPEIDPRDIAPGARLSGQQRAAVAIRLAVQALFFEAASRRAHKRGEYVRAAEHHAARMRNHHAARVIDRRAAK